MNDMNDDNILEDPLNFEILIIVHIILRYALAECFF